MRDYLNALTPKRRHTMYINMTSHKLVTIGSSTVTGYNPEVLQDLQNFCSPERNGKWWKNRVSCHTLPHIKPSLNGHQRWQPRISKNTQIKVWTHHVAYMTTTPDPLPSNLGKGSSIDHLCGGKACCNPAHLVLATHHKSNCDRIGCRGVTLLVYKNLIVAEYPCPHASPGTLRHQLETSCFKLNVFKVSQETKTCLVQLP